MALSRLENFLKNAEGNILYVNPSDFDATDSIENQGNSLTRPFKTIQRALLEAAKFSYQSGRNNDKIDKTTILVYPGTHYVDNRPGFSIQPNPASPNTALYKRRTGKDTWVTDTSLTQFGASTNFDILDTSNDLYKFNSVDGGVILPRGTSIIGLDLRKTKIRPIYVPDPNDDNVNRSSVFNVTGTCYFTAFTILDADPTKTTFKDYTTNRYVPNYSHHKLTVFTYADGVNKVALGNDQTSLTDLEMYYYKVAKAYELIGDYPVNVDFEPTVDEFRIVGDLKQSPLGISSIVGNSSGIVTVTTANLQTRIEEPHGLFVDSPVLISGVSVDGSSYNGSFSVNEVIGLTTFSYITPNPPINFTLQENDYDNAVVTVESDTVSSASPYVFNCSVRSVYGLCGMWADGSKATGFKSMVVAQYTGIGLQKDDNCFVLYDQNTRGFLTNDDILLDEAEKPLHTNSSAIYKKTHESFHIRVSNNAFVQCVSIFAIGYAKQFVTESGGDVSITNSNSNFGAVALESSGFRDTAFIQDDTGFITHVIPPKETEIRENQISWVSIDTEKTISVGSSSKLYLFGFKNFEDFPPYQIDGYRIGAKEGDLLNLNITVGSSQQKYFTDILMPDSSGNGQSAKKVKKVQQLAPQVNNIASNIITFTGSHNFLQGEKIRIFSDNGITPKGIIPDKIYYAIVDGLAANQIKIANSFNDSTSIPPNPITGLGNKGGVLTVQSTVSDKVPGDVGHPIQFDTIQGQWYVNCSPSYNPILNSLVGIGTSVIGDQTSPTFITRRSDNRSIEDKIYKVRYVIPKEFPLARAPQPGFVLQESSSVKLSSASVSTSDLSTPVQLRNDRVIVGASATTETTSTQIVTLTTELPHKLRTGDKVKIENVKSSNNVLGTGLTSTYNGIYEVISVVDTRKITYRISGIATNPGSFISNVSQRSTSQQRNALPYLTRQEYGDTYFIYRVNTIQDHIPGVDGRDGIYQLILLSSNVGVSKNVGYGLSEKRFNQDVRNLYPQTDRDNYNSDPLPSVSTADLSIIGKVITNDKKNSITKEALNTFFKNNRIGFAVTNVSLSGTGNTTITLFTDIPHNLNSVKSLTLTSSGTGYGSTTLYGVPLVGTGGTGSIIRATLTAGVLNSDIRIVDGGSGYAVNDVLTVSPPPGVTPTASATVTVTEINNNINDGLELSGFEQTELNGVYRILSIPSSNSVTIFKNGGVTGYSTNVGDSSPTIYLASKGTRISNFQFTNATTGIVTVTTSTPHGLLVGNKFTITGSGHTIFDNSFIVKSIVGINTFSFNVGVVTQTKSSTTGFLLKNAYSSNGTTLGYDEINLGSRGSYLYVGITTSIAVGIGLSSTVITLSSKNGFDRGDYISVDSEILRIISTASGNSFNVIRGQFSTPKVSAPAGTLVKKVSVIPVETRRPSFLRASGHTFEYVGYGPGNYSTGLPLKHDRTLNDDDILTSQAKEISGGTVVYSGMNDIGEFYSGSKKQNATTGEEKIIEAPIITFTGDDAEGQASNRLSGIYDEILVRERITVEGGPNNNQSSQFYGPTNFTRRLTNTSDEGILVKNLFVKGANFDKPKLITVGLGTPSENINKGSISLVPEPTTSQPYVGNIHIADGNWRRFGLISQESDRLSFRVDKLAIGSTSALNSPFINPFEVNGKAVIKELEVLDSLSVQGSITFQNPIFNNIEVKKTALFTGTGVTYTQVHNTGISKLYDLEVVGYSTFGLGVQFNSNIIGVGGKLGNITIGQIDDNTIDTATGNIVIQSQGNKTYIRDDLFVEGDVTITTPNGLVSISNTGASSDFRLTTNLTSVGLLTTRVSNSNSLQIGVGTVGIQSYASRIDLFDRNNIGFSIVRNAGINPGVITSTTITQIGNANLDIGTRDNANVIIRTNNIERLNVGSSGTITYRQTNSGRGLSGAHLRLNQNGPGDVALSWYITHNNLNRRWYAGIDTSDYSWKLATPSVTVSDGNELFSTLNETKVSISTVGDMTVLGSGFFANMTLSGDLAINGGDLTSTSNIFNFLSTPSVINIGLNAGTISIGSTSSISVVNVRGRTNAISSTTGALVVDGGVGIGRSLVVFGSTRILDQTASASSTTGALIVDGGLGVGNNLFVSQNATVGSNLFVNSTTESTSKDTGALIIEGGTGIEKNLFVGGNISVAGTALIGAATTIVGVTSFRNNVQVDNNLTVRDNLSVEDNLNTRNLNASGISTINVGIITSLQVSGITTFTQDVFIKQQSIKSIISGFSIVFGL